MVCHLITMHRTTGRYTVYPLAIQYELINYLNLFSPSDIPIAYNKGTVKNPESKVQGPFFLYSDLLYTVFGNRRTHCNTILYTQIRHVNH
jgi:hypothetical protein